MISIFSIQFNRPDFISIQLKTLSHFLKDQFEFYVVNNANDLKVKNLISEETKRLRVTEVAISENIDQRAASAYPGYHHTIAMNEVIRSDLFKKNDISVILDGDCFLVKSYSFKERMENCQLLGAFQQRSGRYYLTPVVIGMKPREMENFHQVNLIGSHIYNVTPEDTSKDISYYPRKTGAGYIFDCPVCCGKEKEDEKYHIRLDSGGDMYMYLKSNPRIKVKRASTTSHIKQHCIDKFPELKKHGYSIDHLFEIYDKSFLHYCRSSNWDGQNYDYHMRKTKVLNEFIDAVISGETQFTSDYTLEDNEWNSWPEKALIDHGVYS